MNDIQKPKRLEKILIASIYYFIFLAIIVILIPVMKLAVNERSLLWLLCFGLLVTLAIVLIVLFLSAWEDCFVSND